LILFEKRYKHVAVIGSEAVDVKGVLWTEVPWGKVVDKRRERQALSSGRRKHWQDPRIKRWGPRIHLRIESNQRLATTPTQQTIATGPPARRDDEVQVPVITGADLLK